MKTFEMVAKADADGRTYKTTDMYYTRGKGFHDKNGREWIDDAWENALSRFIHTDGWNEVAPVKMTLAEVCKKIGYPIEIVVG